MLEDFIHNNEKLIVSSSKDKQNIFGYLLNGDSAFILIFHTFETSIKICDLKVFKKRLKLGSKLLDKLESWARENGYKRIFGELVENKDFSPREVLIDFYSKNGYEIKYLDRGMQFAEILKYL